MGWAVHVPDERDEKYVHSI